MRPMNGMDEGMMFIEKSGIKGRREKRFDTIDEET